EPAGSTESAGAATAVAVMERPGAIALAEVEKRVELRKDRLWLPFLIPVGAILTVALFTINLSRIFLAASENSKDPAVVAAIIVTLAVLGGATTIAAIPRLRTSSLVLTLCGIVAIVLLAGSLTLGAAEDKTVKSAEPPGAATSKLEVDATNFQFQAPNFDVPPGVLEIDYVAKEGSHTLAFDEPQFSYFNLSQPGGKSAAKITAVAGQTYTIYCTLPGHRAAGMHSTITVKADLKPGKAEAGTATPTTTAPGATPTTAPSGKSQVDSSSQSGNQLGN
ncbi:MAG: plastocyanin/azurin family copper-binding protein, partial [Acidimicrobiia bacterium]